MITEIWQEKGTLALVAVKFNFQTGPVLYAFDPMREQDVDTALICGIDLESDVSEFRAKVVTHFIQDFHRYAFVRDGRVIYDSCGIKAEPPFLETWPEYDYNTDYFSAVTGLYCDMGISNYVPAHSPNALTVKSPKRLNERR